MPITPPHAQATDFATAVANLRAYALGQFNAAFSKVNVTPPVLLPETALAADREAAKKLVADYAKAQGELAGAFKQIGDTDHTEKEHAGYADAAQLMKTTAATAYVVCLRIGTIMSALPVSGSTTTEIAFQPKQIDQLEALTAVLHALAALSPAAIWQPPASAGESG